MDSLWGPKQGLTVFIKYIQNNYFVFALVNLGCATYRDCGLNKDDDDDDADADNVPNSSYSLA